MPRTPARPDHGTARTGRGASPAPTPRPGPAAGWGKDELNLAEFPIALVTDKAPAGLKTLRFEDRVFDDGKNQVVRRRVIVTASDEFGLPTAKDDEVIVGLIQLTRAANNLSGRSVTFHRADLIRLLGWPETGPSYRRLALAFHRWLGVSLHYENAWWDKGDRRWSTLGFHILETFELTNAAPCSFTWNEHLFRSFSSGYLKSLDLDFYLALKHPTAKRIYRFLDKRFFHRPSWEFDLKEFAFDHVGLTRAAYEGAAQIARKLAPGLAELEEKGFLEPMDPAQRFRKQSASHWRITLARRGSGSGPRVEAEPSALAPPASPPATAMPADPLVVASLVARGVSEPVARELAAAFDAAEIARKAEVLDWLVARGDRKVSRNPSGYLVKSIRDDYSPPPGFEPAADLARRDTEAAAADSQKRSAAAEAAAADSSRAALVRSFLDSLSPAALSSLTAEALATGNPAFARRHRTALQAGDLPLADSYLKLLLDQLAEQKLGLS